MLHLIIDCMSNNYVSTVERLFITNPSSSLNLMWKIIEGKFIFSNLIFIYKYKKQ